jgi:hypothetical protein
MHHHQHGARLDDTGKTAAIGTDVLDSNTHDRLARVIAWREDAFNERDERAHLRAHATSSREDLSFPKTRSP